MKSRYDKLMAVANDPKASPEEREAYRRKAEAIGATRTAKPKRTILSPIVTRNEKGIIMSVTWVRKDGLERTLDL